jgi:hypothetical protein
VRRIDTNVVGLSAVKVRLTIERFEGDGKRVAVLEGRPYRTVDDLRRVKGIGGKRWAEIRPYVKAW